jgi:hypothetical protein
MLRRLPRTRSTAWIRPSARVTDAVVPGSPATRTDVAVGLLVVAALVLWWTAGGAVDLAAMSDLGLGSVLPPAMWAAMLLVTAAFLVALRSGRAPVILLTVVATTVVLHGLGIITEPEMRFSVSWRHIGIADYIGTRGTVDPTLDAYQSWPGFFALFAFVRDVTGLTDPAPLLAWFPVLVNLSYLPPFLVIGRRLLGDGRTVWLGAWIFITSNWIGQDYFSPQGWYLFVYFVIMAVLLAYFMDTGEARSGRAARTVRRLAPRSTGPVALPPPDEPASASQRTVLILSVVALAASMVTGHQLTPFALVLGLAALLVLGWSRLRALPVLVVLGVLLWLGVGAAVYVDGHGEDIRSQVGALGSIFSQTVGERLTGSPGHAAVVRLRLAVTAAFWLLALCGAVRLVRGGRVVGAGLALLAGSAFPLLALQSYGGEALMRIALFASPFMALLAASALVGPISSRPGPRVLGAVAVVAVLSVVTFPFTRYGNERMDWYSVSETTTVREMYRVAPAGSVLTSVTGNLPWRYTGYADYDYRILAAGTTRATGPDVGPSESVDLDAGAALLARQIASRMTPPDGRRSYLIVTRNQGAELELLNGEPPGAFPRLVDVLDGSDLFEVVDRAPDAVLVELTGVPG